MRGVDFEKLRKDIQSDPVTCGYPDRKWTGQLLSAHLMKSYRVRLSARQCQRLLKRLIVGGNGNGDGAEESAIN